MSAKKASQARDKRFSRTWEGCMKTIATSRAEIPKQETPLHETKIFFFFNSFFAFLFLFRFVFEEEGVFCFGFVWFFFFFLS